MLQAGINDMHKLHLHHQKINCYHFDKPCYILKCDNVCLKLGELALLRRCPDSVSAGSPDVEDN